MTVATIHSLLSTLHSFLPSLCNSDAHPFPSQHPIFCSSLPPRHPSLAVPAESAGRRCRLSGLGPSPRIPVQWPGWARPPPVVQLQCTRRTRRSARPPARPARHGACFNPDRQKHHGQKYDPCLQYRICLCCRWSGWYLSQLFRGRLEVGAGGRSSSLYVWSCLTKYRDTAPAA